MYISTKLLFTMWLSSVLTFAMTAAYFGLREDSINAPGELGEALAAIGIVLFAVLVVLSGFVYLFWKR